MIIHCKKCIENPCMVLIFFLLNPLTLMSDQDGISPYNINTISNRQVIKKKYYNINCGVIQGFPALRKAVTTHVKKYRIFSRVLM